MWVGLEEVQRVTVMPTELGGTGTQMNMTLPAYLPGGGGDLTLWLHRKSRESGERSDGRYETVYRSIQRYRPADTRVGGFSGNFINRQPAGENRSGAQNFTQREGGGREG